MNPRFHGALALAGLAALLLHGSPATAHHLIEIVSLQATPLNGLISGLAHPVLGPDHLAFLLALSLIGLRAQGRWMLAMLTLGLLGTLVGLRIPGLPGSELLLALTLGAEALVVMGRLPVPVLLPAMLVHGYGLSAPVLGWSTMPLASYLLGLLLSQGFLLVLALGLLQKLATTFRPRLRSLLAGVLVVLSAMGSFAAVFG